MLPEVRPCELLCTPWNMPARRRTHARTKGLQGPPGFFEVA
ncbi:hypothetical protein STRTUCAR8_05937 [Streptomyces turgidiscabies Car8]|uniref:Uncharacterized protein n=1 Tax=Streptomyces turgidiscabies (strain Car8) TaxID=698760 RepID=L7FDI0_STRT8|nr:hypothetical protein STRTUCAR8_05937 [Streptomyces turgidiscabies Car8]